MSIRKTILSVALAVIMMCAFIRTPDYAMATTYPERTVKVLILCDDSYRYHCKQTYGEYSTDIVEQLVKLAARPFLNVWNMTLDVEIRNYEDVIGIPYSQQTGENGCPGVWSWEIDGDGNPYRKWGSGLCECTDSPYCPGGTTGYHHTSGRAILNAEHEYKESTENDYNVIATFVGHRLCYTKGTSSNYSHHGCGGLCIPSWNVLTVTGQCDYATWDVNGNDKNGANLAISTIHTFQHEFSHMFGCPDGNCSSNGACIMNGAFNGILMVNKLWCASCSERFRTNIDKYDATDLGVDE